MKNQQVNLFAAAGDLKFTVLKPGGDGCAYIIDLGSKEIAGEIHCKNVILEITGDDKGTIHYDDKTLTDIPYWIVENTTNAQMEKCSQLYASALRDLCGDPDNNGKVIEFNDVGFRHLEETFIEELIYLAKHNGAIGLKLMDREIKF